MGGLFYPCSVNKGVDQLLCNREADLRLCFRICKSRFSHEEAQLIILFYLSFSGVMIAIFGSRAVMHHIVCFASLALNHIYLFTIMMIINFIELNIKRTEQLTT